MKIYDISVDICSTMHVFPGDPKFHPTVVKRLENGDPYTLHRISMGNHAGTHVDAPSHFIPGGATIDEVPLEILNGRVRVVQIHNTEKIDLPELQKLVLMDDFRVLFKTKNSMIWGSRTRFEKDYAYLTPEAATYLAENGVKLVGIDYLSIDQYGSESFPVHKILLGNKVALLEGINLSEVEEGEYDMSCLPLRFKNLDAAPARVILRK